MVEGVLPSGDSRVCVLILVKAGSVFAWKELKVLEVAVLAELVDSLIVEVLSVEPFTEESPDLVYTTSET